MLVVEKLKQLVASERKITAEIIEHILEIDRKKIFSQMGYPTLFSFLTEYIGYSASAAQRRIEAARLLKVVPEVKDDLQSGSLNLSQVALVAQSIRQKQKERPEVKINIEDKKLLLMSIKNQNFESSQKIISQSLDLDIKAFDRKVIQKDESVRFEVTFTKNQMEAFNKVKSLMSHVNPSASVAEVFDYLAKDYLKRKDLASNKTAIKNSDCVGNGKAIKNSDCVGNSKAIKNSDCVGNSKAIKNSDCVGNKAVGAKRSITDSITHGFDFGGSKRAGVNMRKPISIKVKRIVWSRDQGKCQHFNPTTGKKCGSDFLLEIDHLKRIRNGGDNHPNNLRLLCKAHNLWRG
jgi:hypothetical protein